MVIDSWKMFDRADLLLKKLVKNLVNVLFIYFRFIAGGGDCGPKNKL